MLGKGDIVVQYKLKRTHPNYYAEVKFVFRNGSVWLNNIVGRFQKGNLNIQVPRGEFYRNFKQECQQCFTLINIDERDRPLCSECYDCINNRTFIDYAGL